MQNEAAIRLKAYEIWETSGMPNGQQDVHWHQASDELTSVAAQATEFEKAPGALRKGAAAATVQTSA